MRFVALCLLLIGFTQSANAEPRTYVIDKEHALVGFLISHIGFAKTFGAFGEFEGRFVFDEEAQVLSDVEITVDTASVDTKLEVRDRHVRGKDFLHVKEHPQMTFTATGGEATGEREGTVTGDLTLRGVTLPVTLDVMWNKSGVYPFGHKLHTIGISARGKLKRSDFGMSYGVGNGLVGDEVELIIEFEANAQ